MSCIDKLDKKKFARNLNNALAKKDWSQSDLARAIGIDVANVNAYFAGQY